jgi:uncharacterized protein
MRAAALFVLLIPRNLGVLLIRGYRAVISPLYGDVCRYYPSCSAYGLGSVQQRGIVVGSALTAWRILRCNPWSAGGIDEVRPTRHGRYRVTAFGWVLPAVGSQPTDVPAPADQQSNLSDQHDEAQPHVHASRAASAPISHAPESRRRDAVHAPSSPTMSRKD